MANYVAGPGVTGATDFATTGSALDRKQKMIDALMAFKGGQGQMVGKHYVAPHMLENIASFIIPMIGAHKGKQLDKERAENAQKYQQGMAGEMTSLGTAGDDGLVPREQIIKMLSSQFPEVRARGEKEMSRLESRDTPFLRMFKQRQGSGQQSPMGTTPPTPAYSDNEYRGDTQSFAVDMPPGMGPNVATDQPSGVQPPPDVTSMFPNLSPDEVTMLLASDPSGKSLVEANMARNKPIVAGNAIFNPAGGGRVQSAPGSLEAMGTFEAVKERAKAPYGNMVEVKTPDGVVLMRPDQAQAYAGGMPSPGGAPAPQGQFQLPEVATPNNFRVPPGQQQIADNDRLGILQQERSLVTDPKDAAALDREIARTQGQKFVAPPRTAPSQGMPGIKTGFGASQADERKGLFEGDVKTVNEFRATAEKSGQAMRAITNIEKSLKGGSFQGAYANVQERSAAFFGPLGISVDATKLKNTQEVKAFVQNLVIPQVKQLGFNPTDADARRIEESVGNITNDPAALDKIMSVLKEEHRHKVDQHKRAESYLRKNRSLEGFDYGFEGSDTPKKMSFDEYARQVLKGK